MTARRHLAALLALASVLTACDTGADDGATGAEAPSEAVAPTQEASPDLGPFAQRCVDETALADAPDPIDAFTCADAVVAVDDPTLLAAAAPLAAALGGPVVVVEGPDGRDALEARWPGAGIVSFLAGDGTTNDEAGDPEARRPWDVGVEAVRRLAATTALAVDEREVALHAPAALLAARRGVPLLVVPMPRPAGTPDDLGDSVVADLTSITIVSREGREAEVEARLRTVTDAAAEVAGESPTEATTFSRLPLSSPAGLLRPGAPASPSRTWLVDADTPDAIASITPLAVLAGHDVVTLAGLDPLAADAASAGRLARTSEDGTLLLAGGADVDVDAFDRALRIVAAGNELPGGGYTLDGKRFVAMYGTPGTSSLGVLGEQGLDATVERARSLAAPYDDGTLTVVPTFEIIATVASASATEDGDYSYGISHDIIREWVDRAAVEGFQVVLDLQSGRTDFLTQAKALEEFLVQPHVGLALDPEWRLKDDQVHLRQIGSVTGDEVNTVVDWLVELTHEHDLPQKMLVLHQFNLGMIRGRDQIRTPEELQVVLHMDGQGSLGAKYGTYGTLFDAGEPQAQGMVAGWKNFYDEDSPMADPGQVLALDPQPVFISFQ